jgi:uncharacterized membrane protein YdbT with pleckstrin-like domain
MSDSDRQHAAEPQETDVWWGAYSGLTLLPSMLVCVLLTGVIVWGTRSFVERRHVQLTFWVLTGAVWLVQSYRWSWRVFGLNYRLTTRRLLIDKGHWQLKRWSVDLRELISVEVIRDFLSAWTGVGHVSVRTAQNERVILESVAAPEELAAKLRAAMQRSQSSSKN